MDLSHASSRRGGYFVTVTVSTPSVTVTTLTSCVATTGAGVVGDESSTRPASR
ncbi:MAG: hypothetical protein QOE98_2665, partial [Gaiellaceae bacterium]|nr:hypothetical protein [Gaiellaceae bacterium]